MKDEKLEYFWGSGKNQIFRGWVTRKDIQGGLPKKGTWTVHTFNGGLGKKE